MKYFTLTTTKIFKLVQSTIDKSEIKLLQPSITTFITTKTTSLSRRNDIVHPQLLPTTTTVSSTIRKPKERKRILKSVKKYGSDSSDQHQPSEARKPTMPKIPLTIANTPFLAVFLNVKYNGKQQAAKNKGKKRRLINVLILFRTRSCLRKTIPERITFVLIKQVRILRWSHTYLKLTMYLAQS